MNRTVFHTLVVSMFSALLLSAGCVVETEDELDREAFIEDEDAESPAPGLEGSTVDLKAGDRATQDYYGCNQNSSCEDWCWCEFDDCESNAGYDDQWVAWCEQNLDNCLGSC